MKSTLKVNADIGNDCVDLPSLECIKCLEDSSGNAMNMGRVILESTCDDLTYDR